VTNTEYDLQTIAKLYLDRADCESGFDELKNQWGWGSFTTQYTERCQTSAVGRVDLQLAELVLPYHNA
jgi:hypothetical protein